MGKYTVNFNDINMEIVGRVKFVDYLPALLPPTPRPLSASERAALEAMREIALKIAILGVE